MTIVQSRRYTIYDKNMSGNQVEAVNIRAIPREVGDAVRSACKDILIGSRNVPLDQSTEQIVAQLTNAVQHAGEEIERYLQQKTNYITFIPPNGDTPISTTKDQAIELVFNALKIGFIRQLQTVKDLAFTILKQNTLETINYNFKSHNANAGDISIQKKLQAIEKAETLAALKDAKADLLATIALQEIIKNNKNPGSPQNITAASTKTLSQAISEEDQRNANNFSYTSIGQLQFWLKGSLERIRFTNSEIQIIEREKADDILKTVHKDLTVLGHTAASLQIRSQKYAIATIHTLPHSEKNQYKHRITIGDIDTELLIERSAHGLNYATDPHYWIAGIHIINPKNTNRSATELNKKLSIEPLEITKETGLAPIAEQIIDIVHPDPAKSVMGQIAQAGQKTRRFIRDLIPSKLHTGLLAAGMVALGILSSDTRQKTYEREVVSNTSTAHQTTRPATTPTPIRARTQTAMSMTPTITTTGRVSESLAQFSPQTSAQANPEFALRQMFTSYPQLLGNNTAARLAHLFAGNSAHTPLSAARRIGNSELQRLTQTNPTDPRAQIWLQRGHRLHTHIGDIFELRNENNQVVFVHSTRDHIPLYTILLSDTFESKPSTAAQAATPSQATQYVAPGSVEYNQIMAELSNNSPRSPETPANLQQASNNTPEARHAKTYLDPESPAYHAALSSDDKQWVNESDAAKYIREFEQSRSIKNRVRSFFRSIFS